MAVGDGGERLAVGSRKEIKERGEHIGQSPRRAVSGKYHICFHPCKNIDLGY
jgi:hypothetical protein